MKKLFGNHVSPSCSYCMNGKKDDTMEVFCTKKLRYVKDENLNKKCRKYKYDPYERIPVSKPKLKKYDSKDFLIE